MKALTPTQQNLVKRYMWLVPCVIRRLVRLWGLNLSSYDREDCQQVGYMGLIRASKNFDPEQNIPFSRYACVCIEARIKRELKKQRGPVRMLLMSDLFQKAGSDPDMIADDGVAYQGEYLEFDLALQQLEERYRGIEQRAIMALRMKIAGEETADIAQALGIKQESVWTYLSIGRKIIRDAGVTGTGGTVTAQNNFFAKVFR